MTSLSGVTFFNQPRSVAWLLSILWVQSPSQKDKHWIYIPRKHTKFQSVCHKVVAEVSLYGIISRKKRYKPWHRFCKTRIILFLKLWICCTDVCLSWVLQGAIDGNQETGKKQLFRFENVYILLAGKFYKAPVFKN